MCWCLGLQHHYLTVCRLLRCYSMWFRHVSASEPLPHNHHTIRRRFYRYRTKTSIRANTSANLAKKKSISLNGLRHHHLTVLSSPSLLLHLISLSSSDWFPTVKGTRATGPEARACRRAHATVPRGQRNKTGSLAWDPTCSSSASQKSRVLFRPAPPHPY